MMLSQPRTSLADDLHQRAFAPAAIELAVEDLFPGAEVELALGDRDHHFATHDLPLHVSVGIVLAGAIVLVLRHRFVRRQRFQPLVVVLMQAALVDIGTTPSVLDAQTYVADFYASFGFVAEGSEFIEDGIPHLRMRRSP